MYIACPECDTKFVVTPKQIGTHGRKVKCSKCSHIWYQELGDNVPIEPVVSQLEPIAPIGNGVNLPALVPAKTPSYLFWLPGMVIILIFVMLVILFPSQLGITSLLNSNEVSVEDIQIVNQEDVEKVVVEYKVHNNSLDNVQMPLVRVRLFDKNHNILSSRIDDHSDTEMYPDQIKRVRTKFTSVPSSVGSIDVMIGNKLDFILH